MSAENIEPISHAASNEEKSNERSVNEDLLEEVRELKKVISTLAERESLKSKQSTVELKVIPQLEQINPQSEILESKIHKANSNENKLNAGSDIYKNFKNEWKVRMTSKQKAAPRIRQQHEETLNKLNESKFKYISQLDQEKSSNLDESIIDKHLSFLNSRSDTDEEQPAKTQFFAPETKQSFNQSNQLRFKKMDIIPEIDNEHNRFRSYITTQRKNMISNRNQRYQTNRQSDSTASGNKIKIAVSQPQLPKNQKKPSQSREVKIAQELKRIEITRQTQKEMLIENGKKLFTIFYELFNEETIFTIKKYKNCIVFSLMPAVTKAIIYHYIGDIYFGNVSLDEKGRIEKNGVGMQIVKQRHFYEGQFINGKKNGRGKIIYENGDAYDGQWNEGEIYGFGRYTDSKKDGIFEGFWRKGEYCGQKTSKQPLPFQFF